MCFAPEAVPPPMPESLLVTPERPDCLGTTLTSADGSRLLVSYALAPKVRGPGVLILPDVRGLFGYYRNLAREFAAAGHHAVVIDYFGRTAGDDERPNDFDFLPHIRQTTPTQVQQDLRAAATLLRDTAGATDLVTVGFCFGGSQSYLATTDRDLGLSGTVSFYGGLDETRLGVFPRPAREAERMHGPMLAIFGGADPSIPEELVNEFDAALTRAGVEHELVVYPDAPHSFFDRAHGSFAVQCADAWTRVLGFIRAL